MEGYTKKSVSLKVYDGKSIFKLKKNGLNVTIEQQSRKELLLYCNYHLLFRLQEMIDILKLWYAQKNTI